MQVQDDVGPARYVACGNNENDTSRSGAKLWVTGRVDGGRGGHTDGGALSGGVVAYSEVTFPLEGVNDEVVLVHGLDSGFGEDPDVGA